MLKKVRKRKVAFRKIPEDLREYLEHLASEASVRWEPTAYVSYLSGFRDSHYERLEREVLIRGEGVESGLVRVTAILDSLDNVQYVHIDVGGSGYWYASPYHWHYLLSDFEESIPPLSDWRFALLKEAGEDELAEWVYEGARDFKDREEEEEKARMISVLDELLQLNLDRPTSLSKEDFLVGELGKELRSIRERRLTDLGQSKGG